MEVLELSAESKENQARHEQLIERVEAERRARSIVVPTNDLEVQRILRGYNEPICLFGEMVRRRIGGKGRGVKRKRAAGG